MTAPSPRCARCGMTESFEAHAVENRGHDDGHPFEGAASRYRCQACGTDYDQRPCPKCFPAASREGDAAPRCARQFCGHLQESHKDIGCCASYDGGMCRCMEFVAPVEPRTEYPATPESYTDAVETLRTFVLTAPGRLPERVTRALELTAPGANHV